MSKKIEIGKFLIEILTEGMYKDPLFMYREYIQNATDAIDDAVELKLLEKLRSGKIHVKIHGRSIFITDNGTGIKADEIHRKLYDIAHSDKDYTKRKGFRGIGRLGGIAYCETLKFITSYKNEPIKSILTIDCENIRKELTDPDVKIGAQDLILNNFSVETDDAKSHEHYFTVQLDRVKKDLLLDQSNVEKYLSYVSPIPYPSSFSFKKKIKEVLSNYEDKIGVILPEYDIFINDNQLYKPYSDNLYSNNNIIIDTIVDVECEEIIMGDEVIAVFWYGICKYKKSLSTITNPAGIRYRQWNIQIGDADTVKDLFTESKRGTYYFVGEIHCISKQLIANARRDSFNHNDVLTSLEKRLKEKFRVLNSLYRKSNEIINMLKKKSDYKEKIDVYNRASAHGFKNESERLRQEALLNANKETAVKQLDNIEKFTKSESDVHQRLSGLFKSEINNYTIDSINEIEDQISVNQQLNIKDNDKQVNLNHILKNIEDVLEESLPHSRVNSIMMKIKEKLS
jgi:hypothetical protein